VDRLLEWLRRYWLALLLIIAFAVLIALSYNELQAIARVLLRSRWQWIAVAVILQGIYYVVYTYEYVLGFAAVGVQSRVLELLPVLFASIFVKAVIPSGGISSLAVFIQDASRRGQPGARAAEGSLLILVADLVAVIPLIIIGLVYLAARHVLVDYQLLTSILFLVFTAVLIVIVLLGRWLPRQLQHGFIWTERGINWVARTVTHRPWLPVGWGGQQAAQFIGAAHSLTKHPRLIGYIFGTALAGHLINLISLAAVSLAYSSRLGAATITAAFAMNIVFSVITILPHGLGVAESVMVLVFLSLGVALPVAIVITVAYRGLNVWLPIVIGFFFLRQVTTHRRRHQ